MPHSNAMADAEYEEMSLPREFRPMNIRQLIWHKISSMPLVGVGILSVVGSFGMASYWMRLGNPVKFNYWLRWRVGTQFFTLGALIYYGGVAFTRERQKQLMTEQMVMTGDLPSNTKIRQASNNPFTAFSSQHEAQWRQAALHPDQELSESPDTVPAEEFVPDEAAARYPKPASERMTPAAFREQLEQRQARTQAKTQQAQAARVGVQPDDGPQRGDTFAARLDDAIRKQAEEDESRAKGELRGAQSATERGELLRRRGKEMAAQKEDNKRAA